jgi:membrane protein required for colicin V production
MELSELKNFDYIILLIIIASSYLGFKKGFVESFIDFFAWVGSAIITLENYNYLNELFGDYIPSDFICAFVASVGVYIGLVVTISILGTKIVKLASQFVGGTTDKIIGGIFGSLRGFLIAAAVFWSVYMVMHAVDHKNTPEWLKDAKSYEVLDTTSGTLFDAITSESQRKKLLNSFEKKSDSLTEEVQDNARSKNKSLKKEMNSSEYFQE